VIDIYVLVDAKTGELWTQKSTGRFSKRRAVNAFKSYARAQAVLDKMDHQDGSVEIQRYAPKETDRSKPITVLN
jgi:hypothetical protein